MSQEKNTYRLGIALSGGGAKGFAHLGILQALNEKGLYPEVISGTSAGALAGVLYADGYSPEEILSFFNKKVFREFAELAISYGGFFKSGGLQSFLKKYLRARTFENLKLPLYVLAADIEYGESKAFSSGPLIPAVIASCSVPIIFRPVEIDNRLYVDGGLFKNFPVSTIRHKCHKVIGVNVNPLVKTGFRNSIKHIAERSLHYMLVSNTLIDRSLCDYLIELDTLFKYPMFGLAQEEKIYQAGYDLAMEFFNEKKNLLVKDFPNIVFKHLIRRSAY